MEIKLGILFTILASTSCFASSSVTYNCVGRNEVDDRAISFELAFGAGGPNGYQDESISIEKIGYEVLEKKLRYQMHGASKYNECTKNEEGDIFLSNFKMIATEEDDIAPYKVKFHSDCDFAGKFTVNAYCFFQH